MMIFLADVLMYEKLHRHDILADALSGHSLGEYGALVY